MVIVSPRRLPARDVKKLCKGVSFTFIKQAIRLCLGLRTLKPCQHRNLSNVDKARSEVELDATYFGYDDVFCVAFAESDHHHHRIRDQCSLEHHPRHRRPPALVCRRTFLDTSSFCLNCQYLSQSIGNVSTESIQMIHQFLS